MKRFPRGSVWRKWDLHVHPPRTKLADAYDSKDGEPDWARFCKWIHDSDVQAIGIADYFSLDGYFAFKDQYNRCYPDSDKVIFPNLELRLNETVNQAVELVDFHIILRPDLTHDKATEFLRELKTQRTDDQGRKQSCADLRSHDDYDSATVSRDDLANAIKKTWGEKAVWTDHVVTVAAANNNGIRADTGNKRKMIISDEVDKVANCFFGSSANTKYFLDSGRYDLPNQKAPLKPVFSGSDAHSFADLEAWLGNEVSGANQKHVTWVKADMTFEGLQQTLIEPAERVRIQETIPDPKEPYKVISRITFGDSNDFPAEVVFNPGLNAIIGSRSSGKSALLAYVAHAVDPEYVVRQQVAAGIREREAGPGASFTWDDVKGITYKVEWASPGATTGRVIYIPQNSLYAISERPDDITAKIQPAVFRGDTAFESTFRQSELDVENCNERVRTAVAEWFALAGGIRKLTDEIHGMGDRTAITIRVTELTDEIGSLQKSSLLSSDEIATYQKVVDEIGKNEARIAEIVQEQHGLAPYVKTPAQEGVYEATDRVVVNITMTPSPTNTPAGLQSVLATLIDRTRGILLAKVSSRLIGYRMTLDDQARKFRETDEKLRVDNKALIEKSAANAQIAALVKNVETQRARLAEIDKKAAFVTAKAARQRECADSIAVDIKARDNLLAALAEGFNTAANHKSDHMVFTLEIEYDDEDVDRLSSGFNKHETSPYILDQKRVDVRKALSEPVSFIEHMGSGKQKLKQGADVVTATTAVLTATMDVRFVASLEGDRIGGFKTSSMTPGKQALFALKLILAESDEPWPLLIDQPEDDLDSRSVCDVIVKDLMRRKRERQVIMVSHNANLVIGADSEEIIIANRHGDDRPNKGSKAFAYLTGSLEHSKPKDLSEKLALESAGIREHACEILDGGAEAFQKRKDKYRI